jgi:hypothetical protein
MRLTTRVSRLPIRCQRICDFRPQAGGPSEDFAARLMFDGLPGTATVSIPNLSSLAGYAIDCSNSICPVPLPIHESPLPSFAWLAKRLEQRPLLQGRNGRSNSKDCKGCQVN